MTDMTTETARGAEIVADFTRTLTIKATADTLRTAITTAAGVSGWWMPTRSPEPGLLRISFGDKGLDVRVMTMPELVVWDVVDCSAEPDWVGTTIEFASGAVAAGAANAAGLLELTFTHRGLGGLPCAESCFAGWTHFLPSLQSFVESGTGDPGRWR
jgi:hypothetical protein